MKSSTIKYTRVLVRGTNSPSGYHETNTNHVTIIQLGSSKSTVPPARHRRTNTIAKTGKVATKPKTQLLSLSRPPPLPPPKPRPTVHDLAVQLEYRILHHSGYIPKGAVPIALFQLRRSMGSIH
jgi:hypothetical protein